MQDASVGGAPPGTVERYIEVRSLTEAIAEPLSAEDQTAQSMPDVSPTKWHRAHVTWFFEEFVLGPHAKGYEPFDARFRFLFNSYYEAVGERHPRPERGVVTRPGIAEVAAYRRHVDAAMVELLADPPEEVLALVELGLHHEQQHQELALMDIKHVLSRNVLDPVYRPTRRDDRLAAAGVPADPATDPATEPVTEPSAHGDRGWLEHPGGLVEVGHDGDGFAFDNEGPRHRQHLESFGLAASPVTCGDVLAFIDDDGYRRPELWLSDGWAAVQAQGWEAPLYWRREDDGDWSVFTLGGRRAVDPAEPVCHVSYYEADAIARWADARLPSEAEWEAVAALRPVRGNLLDLDVVHPLPAATAPVGSLGPGAGGDPVGLFGDVWEWTASAYLPYPGFRPASGAVGEYNGKFMVNQHVLRGGSCLTPPGHVRATYRNFFPPSARWPMTGLRLARDLEAR